MNGNGRRRRWQQKADVAPPGDPADLDLLDTLLRDRRLSGLQPTYNNRQKAPGAQQPKRGDTA